MCLKLSKFGSAVKDMILTIKDMILTLRWPSNSHLTLEGNYVLAPHQELGVVQEEGKPAQ